MNAIKRKNPLTESFLVQLDVDLEGAGLESSTSLRNQIPRSVSNRSPSCPGEHLGMPTGAPTYGDIGLAAYNDPNSNITITSGSNQSSNFGYNNMSEMSDESNMGFIPSTNQFDLPNRQRSPASNPSSGVHRSPQSYNPDMDMSPDANAGGHQTPNSSTQSQQNMSSHTSNTSYSPQNLQQQDLPTSGMQTAPHRLPGGLFASNSTDFTSDFDMNTYPTIAADNQPQGFVLPSNWGTGSTGLTPGPSGMTPGASGLFDMTNMTDADWNSMMDNMNFSGWETGVAHDGDVHMLPQPNRRI